MASEITNITAGPTTETLKDRFFDRGSAHFQTRVYGYISIGMTMIEHEDGSGHSWNIEGQVKRVDRGDFEIGCKVKLYYRSDFCSGFLTPLRQTVAT
jgi:hypothetical protein